jgi:hypothetical protein
MTTSMILGLVAILYILLGWLSLEVVVIGIILDRIWKEISSAKNPTGTWRIPKTQSR